MVEIEALVGTAGYFASTQALREGKEVEITRFGEPGIVQLRDNETVEKVIANYAPHVGPSLNARLGYEAGWQRNFGSGIVVVPVNFYLIREVPKSKRKKRK
ncbi:hypothetical protein ACFL0X_02465 [Nanoarchaeota archaeon]